MNDFETFLYVICSTESNRLTENSLRIIIIFVNAILEQCLKDFEKETDNELLIMKNRLINASDRFIQLFLNRNLTKIEKLKPLLYVISFKIFSNSLESMDVPMLL
jgi:hypothetical protein